MSRVYIGIDNGVTGAIGIVGEGIVRFEHTPTTMEQSYTKFKQLLRRVDTVALKGLLEVYKEDAFVCIERPLVNPRMFKATMSALRALEATLIVIETIGMSYQYVDSREWQSVLLPASKEKGALKFLSLQVGKRLFPQIDFKGFEDADGLLLAEWARRMKK